MQPLIDTDINDSEISKKDKTQLRNRFSRDGLLKVVYNTTRPPRF